MTGRHDGAAARQRPAVVRSGGGETMFDRPGRAIRVLVDHDELALTLFAYGPGEEGPSPHVHRRHVDAFYVLEGELEVGLGPEVELFTAAPGTLAAAPPDLLHTFRNASEGRTVFLNVHAPSMRFADMLRAARDGGDVEASNFDQFDPPGDGGRPLVDAVLRADGDVSADVDGLFSLRQLELDRSSTSASPEFQDSTGALYVLEGTLALRLDGEEAAAGPGDLAFLPPGVECEWTSVGAEPTRLLSLAAPAEPSSD